MNEKPKSPDTLNLDAYRGERAKETESIKAMIKQSVQELVAQIGIGPEYYFETPSNGAEIILVFQGTASPFSTEEVMPDTVSPGIMDGIIQNLLADEEDVFANYEYDNSKIESDPPLLRFTRKQN